MFGIENKTDYFLKKTWYVNGDRHDNASLEPDTIMLCASNPEMLKAGKAVSKWKDNYEEYQKIQGILIDVKILMNINVRQEMKEIEKLVKLIES